jgi:hypothetical protein
MNMFWIIYEFNRNKKNQLELNLVHFLNPEIYIMNQFLVKSIDLLRSAYAQHKFGGGGYYKYSTCKIQAIECNFVDTRFFCFLLALTLSERPEMHKI